MSTKSNSTTDLYNTADVKKVRELLTKEQFNTCAVTGLDIPVKQHVLDHVHDETQLVRGVLHRQVNAFLGKSENAFTRLIAWWYPNDLPTLLRECADYLEKEPDTRYRHNMWIKKINTAFNKLKEAQKDSVLVALGKTAGKNAVERKKLFQSAVLTKQFSYDTLRDIINKEKDV
jgi:hypothetical protein